MKESPSSLEQSASFIRQCFEEKTPLRLAGGNTKPGWPREVEAECQFSSSALSGVISYEPEELMLTAHAGTHIDEIKQILEQKGQSLPFDPPNFSNIFGADHAGTLGGIISTGLSGSQSFSKGPVRDFVLAIKAVNGQGEIFNAGAKVVKNVTGYDIPKLLTGAFGTLAFLGEVTIKVLPYPKAQWTLLFDAHDKETVKQLLRLARQSDKEISACAYLPDQKQIVYLLQGGALRERRLALEQEAARESSLLKEEESQSFWADIRDMKGFEKQGNISRITIPPAKGVDLLVKLQEKIPDGKFILDWGGALLGIGHHKNEPRIHDIVERMEGHITYLKMNSNKDNDIRLPGLTLMKKVKAAFDPARILNPGKLHPDI